MLIDEIYPGVVAEKSTLRERLIAAATTQDLTNERTNIILDVLPDKLAEAGCFLDRKTGLWRYEFGVPFDINGQLTWGTDMWVPVKHLLTALSCALGRLPRNKLAVYLERLVNLRRHQEVLVEMIPASRIGLGVHLGFLCEAPSGVPACRSAQVGQHGYIREARYPSGRCACWPPNTRSITIVTAEMARSGAGGFRPPRFTNVIA